MAAIDFASTLITGLVLLIILVGVSRARNWEHDEPLFQREESLTTVLYSPATWTITFLVVALIFTGGAIAYIGGLPVEIDPELIGFALLGLFGVIVLGFLFVGVYTTARNRGLSSAPAVGVSSATLGILVLAVILVRLIIN